MYYADELGKLKKKKKKLDGLSPTYLKPPPPAPLKMDYVFFTIVLSFFSNF